MAVEDGLSGRISASLVGSISSTLPRMLKPPAGEVAKTKGDPAKEANQQGPDNGEAALSLPTEVDDSMNEMSHLLSVHEVQDAGSGPSILAWPLVPGQGLVVLLLPLSPVPPRFPPKHLQGLNHAKGYLAYSGTHVPGLIGIQSYIRTLETLRGGGPCQR